MFSIELTNIYYQIFKIHYIPSIIILARSLCSVLSRKHVYISDFKIHYIPSIIFLFGPYYSVQYYRNMSMFQGHGVYHSSATILLLFI
jgi:hypothetical protein